MCHHRDPADMNESKADVSGMAYWRHQGRVVIVMMRWDCGESASVVTRVQPSWMAFTFAATMASVVALDMLNKRA